MSGASRQFLKVLFHFAAKSFQSVSLSDSMAQSVEFIQFCKEGSQSTQKISKQVSKYSLHSK